MRLSSSLQNKIPSILASIYESSGSHFFRITTGIQLGPDPFDKLRLVMTFLTNLGATWILCSFKLVLQEKDGKGIPVSSRYDFIEKLLASNYFLLEAEDNKQRRYSRFTFVDNTISKLRKLTIFATITSSHEFHFRCRRFLLL